MKKLAIVVLVSIFSVLLECWYLYQIRNGGTPYKINISPTNAGG